MSGKMKNRIKKIGLGAKAFTVFLITLKDSGKFVAFAIEIWAMVLMFKFAHYNAWSKEILDSLMPGITALFQTIAIVIGASLGVTKVVDTVVTHLDKRTSSQTPAPEKNTEEKAKQEAQPFAVDPTNPK